MPTKAPVANGDEIAGTGLHLANLSDEEVIAVRAAVEFEMRRRGIALSVGAVGEQLAIDYFRSTAGLPKLQRAPVGTKSVDALSRDGERYSIKTICNAKKTGTVYPDAQNKDKQLFEYLLIVRITPSWALKSIHQLDWPSFLAIRSWDKRMNAWYVAISSRSLARATTICDASPSSEQN